VIDGGDLMGYTPTNQIGNTKKPTMTRDEKPATHKIGIAGHWVKTHAIFSISMLVSIFL